MNNTNNMIAPISVDELFDHKGNMMGVRIILENGEVIEHGTCGRRCIVKGCQNTSAQGKFVGDLCKSCHDYLVSGKIGVTSSFLGELKQVSPAPPTLPTIRLLLIDPMFTGFNWAIVEGNVLLKQGHAYGLEEIKSLSRCQSITDVFINDTYRTNEARLAAGMNGWHCVRSRATGERGTIALLLDVACNLT